MRRWAVIQHAPIEGPGLVADVARESGVELAVHHPYRGEPLPRLDAVAGLVVLGGTMGARDDERHPHLIETRRLLVDAAAAELPVLGICLGAQLLASALGASVTRGPAAEVGLGEVEITDAGRADAVFAPCAPTLPVVHWHEDTYELPAGAVQLARGSRYAQQAFRAGRRAYGLQFHIEVDRELARAWAPALPEGVDLDEPGRARVERSGRQLLGRLFAAALQ